MSAKKLPAFMFYPSDWMSDMKVKSLTFEQQGIWWNIICVMHECDERGKLILNGQPIPRRTLAQLISCDLKKLNITMDVLIKQNVAYVDGNGIVYNKRMVEDERIIQLRRAAGKLGGNPNLLNQNDKEANKQKPTPSSSISNSDSISERVHILKQKSIENNQWLEQTSAANGIPTHAIKTFCTEWITKAQLRYQHEKYEVHALIGFMLTDLQKAKPKLIPKEEKKKVPEDFWN